MMNKYTYLLSQEEVTKKNLHSLNDDFDIKFEQFLPQLKMHLETCKQNNVEQTMSQYADQVRRLKTLINECWSTSVDRDPEIFSMYPHITLTRTSSTRNKAQRMLLEAMTRLTNSFEIPTEKNKSTLEENAKQLEILAKHIPEHKSAYWYALKVGLFLMAALTLAIIVTCLFLTLGFIGGVVGGYMSSIFIGYIAGGEFCNIQYAEKLTLASKPIKDGLQSLSQIQTKNSFFAPPATTVSEPTTMDTMDNAKEPLLNAQLQLT